jgi:hypothetical protein
MTKHASRLCCVALGSVLCLAGACEDEVKVPDRVWDAAMAVCERWKGCDGSDFADRYTSVEECADLYTKYFPWDEYTEECIEAHIASFECVAAAPCFGWSDECHFPAQLRSYHCWRYDTSEWGVVCGDPSSADWQEECDWQCGPEYESHLCSEQTPDYCQCGDEQCAQGEYCCTCLDLD